ncbi:MAG: 3-phosphoshikimate 1-carboxyvinyltransferase [Oscillospiraceae bacterium]|jgi:3-phosphoshikimate 1-carboxyvinyltransferase|nr:3-phosphoshikimate 1-carboxyvinyltransferase [Oscillospiraceae bacterium]
MEKRIKLIPSKLSGAVSPPPSKSLAHRAIICAALAEGLSHINNIAFSDDITATIRAVERLGAFVEIQKNSLVIDGGNTFSKNELLIDCNESGSTLRFMIPVALARPRKANFTGRGRLGERPLDPFYPLFEKDEINWAKSKGAAFNFAVRGSLKGGNYQIPGNISSQFITGLLFALPLLEKNSTIEVTAALESRPYIDLTLDVLEAAGIEIQNENYRFFRIKGGQKYKNINYTVESDYSQAAFFLCANAIGNAIDVQNLNPASRQGDRAIMDCLKKTGGGAVIDGSQFPDIIPALSVACALSPGSSRIINIGRLRLKECDRLNAIAKELGKIGADIKELEDSLLIRGVESLTGGQADSRGDHRMAMSLAIAATRCEKPLVINDFDCVKKTYPNFWDDYKMLGGRVE